MKSYIDLFHFVEPGQLLTGTADHFVFEQYWNEVDGSTFDAPEKVLKLRETKLR